MSITPNIPRGDSSVQRGGVERLVPSSRTPLSPEARELAAKKRNAAMKMPLDPQQAPISMTPEEKTSLSPFPNLPSLPELPSVPQNQSTAKKRPVISPTHNARISEETKPQEIVQVATLGVLHDAFRGMSGASDTLNEKPEPKTTETTTTQGSAVVSNKPIINTATERCATLFQKMKSPIPGETASERNTRLAENINTTNEILYGYKSVMSTEDLFKGMAEAYKTATPDQKCAYLEFASKWLNSKAYKEDLDIPEVKMFIEGLSIKGLADKDRGVNLAAEFLKRDLDSAKKSESIQSKSKMPSKVKCKNLEDVRANCENNPAKVAGEFRDLLSEVQSKATVNSILLSMGSKTKESPGAQAGLAMAKASNGLTYSIMDDILFPKDKSKKLTEKEKINERFNFYLQVGIEAIINNDPATLISVYSALTAVPVRRLELDREEDNSVLFNLVDSAAQQTVENKKMREMYERSSSNPIPSFIQTDINKIKEKESTRSINQKQEYVAANIADMANTLEGMTKKIDGMKSRIAQTNFDLDFLSKNKLTETEQEDLCDARSLEIKPRKGGGGNRTFTNAT